MSDVDPRRGACLPTDEGLEELGPRSCGAAWRASALICAQARLDGISRAAARSLCAAQGSDGVPDAKIQLTTGTTFRVTALIFFPFLSWGYETGTFFDEEGSLL